MLPLPVWTNQTSNTKTNTGTNTGTKKINKTSLPCLMKTTRKSKQPWLSSGQWASTRAQSTGPSSSTNKKKGTEKKWSKLLRNSKRKPKKNTILLTLSWSSRRTTKRPASTMLVEVARMEIPASSHITLRRSSKLAEKNRKETKKEKS